VVPPACKGAAVAATENLRRAVVAAGLSTGLATSAAVLPEDKAEALVHVYSGGGMRATGPALLVRKSMAGAVSVAGQFYVDAVSNASIDVVTTASPFKETRTAYDLSVDTVVRDTSLSLGFSRSVEPDYLAQGFSFDTSNEVFSGLTTVSLGFTRSQDKVGKKGVAGWIDQAAHWQYRGGITQILSPRWLVSANAEITADSGFLGSPYRAARVFGAAVQERNPRTRTGRAVKLRSITDTDAFIASSSLRAEYRYYWDTWAIKAHTFELGGSKYLNKQLLLDTTLRHYSQGQALFYSDNASSETQYVSRNRQLSRFKSMALGARLTYTWPGLPAGFDAKLVAGYEFKRFTFDNFTDLRTGGAFAYNAHVLQLGVNATF
jgi:Protein of unknown function (DUF3570)